MTFGLALGGLLGGYLAWKLGVALGPGSNIIATAKSVRSAVPSTARWR
ncbi:hypothetical protein GXW82_22585 [Streptacidiphilus sp. 4-A2]|nr:hypothetical protein [Streptacidiphilus sp. 4-A2]